MIIKQAINKKNRNSLEQYIEMVSPDYLLKFPKEPIDNLNYFVWGVPDDEKGNNKRLLEEFREGDIVFFSLDNEIKYVGEVKCSSILKREEDNDVTGKNRSYNLWKNDTFELIYYLKKVIAVSCSFEDFNSFLGYDRKASFRGVTRIAKSIKIKNISDGKGLLFQMYIRGLIKSI